MGVGASISHQVSDAALRECGAQDILGFLITWSAVNGKDGRVERGHTFGGC